MNDINAKTEDWDWARAAQPQTAAETTASVKMMLTQADKQALRDLGYSDEAISHMTPDAGAGILAVERLRYRAQTQRQIPRPLGSARRGRERRATRELARSRRHRARGGRHRA